MNDLWGPLAPPRWQSNYEQSILNQQMGREAAASFNQAWNASYGRAQQTKEEDKRERNKIQRQHEEEERAIGQIENAKREEYAKRRHQAFVQTITPFMKDLRPEGPNASPYGSPGGPGGSIAPWTTETLPRVTDPLPSDSIWEKEQTPGSNSLFPPAGSGGGSYLAPSSSPWMERPPWETTGASDEFDPTFQDYQRAKATHPALWINPITATAMEKMDRNWEEMEKVRILAEQTKIRGEALKAKQTLDQMAIDVGKQGATRFAFREDAFLKAPSEVQEEIEALPDGGRYPKNHPISIQLNYPPLTAKAEGILNKWRADNGMIRIDGLNRDEINKAEMEAREKTKPGGRWKITMGSDGKITRVYEDPKPGENPNEEPVKREISLKDGRTATLLFFPGAKTFHIDWGNGKTDALTPAQSQKMADSTTGEDRELFKQYAIETAKKKMGGFKPSAKPTEEEKPEEGGGFWDKIYNLFETGKKLISGKPEEGKPTQISAPAPTGTNAPAPATGTNAPAPATNAPPKSLPHAKNMTPADVERVKMLLDKAEKEGRDRDELIKRLREMGLELKQ